VNGYVSLKIVVGDGIEKDKLAELNREREEVDAVLYGHGYGGLESEGDRMRKSGDRQKLILGESPLLLQRLTF
jgi:hypothetical protein